MSSSMESTAAGSSSTFNELSMDDSGLGDDSTLQDLLHDYNIKDLLRDWDLQELTQRFLDQQINVETLKLLNESEIKELIPTVGLRVKFLAKLKVYKDCTSFSVDDLPPSSVPAASANVQAPANDNAIRRNPVDHDAVRSLASIIKTYFQSGNAAKALAIYEKKKEISKSNKQYIAHAIIEGEIGADLEKQIKPERFMLLRAAVCTLFPEEDQDVWYIPRKITPEYPKGVAPKGILYNVYTNFAATLRSSDCRLGKQKPVKAEKRQQTDDEKKSIQILQEGLKEPWTEVCDHWRVTHDIRLDQLKTNSSYRPKRNRQQNDNLAPKKKITDIQDYMNAYECLKQPQGFELFEQDFNTMFPNADAAFNTRWPLFKKAIIKTEELPEDASDIDILKAFSSKFKSRMMNGGTKLAWHASAAEVSNNFIFIIKSSELTKELDNLEKQYGKIKKPLQPLPIVTIEDSEELKVVQTIFMINKITFNVEDTNKKPDVLRTIIACFKAYHALHAKYPTAALNVWNVFQKLLFDIQTPWDEEASEISGKMKLLKAAMDSFE